MHKVVVIGAAVIDVLIQSSSLKIVKGHNIPGGVAMCEVLGGKTEGERGCLETGGGGTNVAVGLHRLGEAVKLVSRVGKDDAGSMVLKKMEDESVDTTMVQIGDHQTGLSSVLVAQGGARSIVTFRGESGEIVEEKIDWEELKKADWIQISSLGGNIGMLEDLASFAVGQGIKIGVNPGKGEIANRDSLLKLLPSFDFFNVNRMEASTLIGVDFDNEKEIIKGLLGFGARVLAITDGRRGASIVSNRRWIKMDAYPNKSIDDTGAGDAFVSGALVGLLEYKNLDETLKMGLANGGSVVTKLGSKDGLLFRSDLSRWLVKKLNMTEEWV